MPAYTQTHTFWYNGHWEPHAHFTKINRNVSTLAAASCGTVSNVDLDAPQHPIRAFSSVCSKVKQLIYLAV
jgi:hypothetical protein